jgi:FtsP/CotA-like multicopper oxidase with cupredoxin domain
MTQEGMGLTGMFVIHPRHPKPEYHVDRDFVIMLSEWAIVAGTSRPNTLEMRDFNSHLSPIFFGVPKISTY